MRRLKFLFISILIVSFFGCEQDDYEFGDIQSPTNLVITADIQGADDDNPFGDGSGYVTFTAVADGAISYKFTISGVEYLASGGILTHRFTTIGTYTYDVEVLASGTAGIMSNGAISVEVLYSFEPPAELLEDLTSGSWRVMAEAPGHLGVHAANTFHDGVNTFPLWYSAAPFDKSETGMYDDRITFNSDGTMDYEAFDYIFGKDVPLEEDFSGNQGLEAVDGEHPFYPIEDFTSNWSISEADGYLVINFTGNGFAGFYVGGSHSYTITYQSSTEMYLKTIGFDNNAWYIKLTNQ